jgi:enoyl-CoA hydratase
MLLMARNISVEEAWRWGLVNKVVDDVQAEAEQWAATIAGYSPAAVQATKRLATFSRRLSAAERTEVEAARALIETHDDYKEGAAAFTSAPNPKFAQSEQQVRSRTSGSKGALES